jgi:hypothetical protein
MTDLVFEDPPRKTRRSEHWDYLLALKEHPATETFSGWARYRGTEVMTERLATGLAASLRAAAAKFGEGWEITARMLPTGTSYGVWARYVPVAEDEPPAMTATGGICTPVTAIYEPVPLEVAVMDAPDISRLPDEPEFHDDNGERDADPGAWLDEYAG